MGALRVVNVGFGNGALFAAAPAALGTSFNAVVEALRRELALTYLRD
jgi:hypothetical protein